MILARGALRDVRLLKMFLRLGGADPNLATTASIHSMRTDGHMSHTPLHTVVSSGVALDCAIELIRAGADVNACRIRQITNERGHGQDLSETPLHIAAQNGSVEWCSLLLSKGADVDAVQKYLHCENVDTESPTDDPRDERFVPSVCLIRVRQSALHIAIKNGNSGLVGLLMFYKANKSAPYIFGDERKTVEELCTEQVNEEVKRELQDALVAEWSKDMHKFFPKSFQDSVRTTLLAAKRKKWPIDTEDIMGRIFAYAANMKGEANGKQED